ncbi:GAF domain-containing protein [Persicobacter diffluens]|uniref:PAS domain-containing protein n=1 Tax=Persicobacter diffluens TaxID=981 RepID=A0AAN4W0Y9_9BACT|nr:hypothetical protein PEDI_30420 [Persicobacter diffluens]
MKFFKNLNLFHYALLPVFVLLFGLSMAALLVDAWWIRQVILGFTLLLLAMQFFIFVKLSGQLRQVVIALDDFLISASGGRPAAYANGFSFLQEGLKLVKENYQGIEEKSRQLEAGNYEMLSEQTAGVAGRLNRLGEEMKVLMAGEQERRKTAEMNAAFSRLLHEERNSKSLNDQALKHVLKNLTAVQGALYQYDSEVEALEMIACYAYDRKKYLHKKIEVGEGMVGQAWLEQEDIYLTDIPEEFLEITSGLGEALPRNLILKVLKNQEEVIGVLELAAFQLWNASEMEFLQYAAEQLAAVLLANRESDKNVRMLQEMTVLTNQMKSQEETLQQHMEQLHDSQVELEHSEKQTKRNNQLLQTLVATIPLPLFVKDDNFRYAMVNDAQAALLGFEVKDLLGLSDADIIDDAEEKAMIFQSDQNIIEQNKEVVLDAQAISLANGQTKYMKTIKTPFRNELTGKMNILGISIPIPKPVPQTVG